MELFIIVESNRIHSWDSQQFLFTFQDVLYAAVTGPVYRGVYGAFRAGAYPAGTHFCKGNESIPGRNTKDG